MRWQIKNRRFVLTVDPEDIEDLRYALGEVTAELVGDEFPLLDRLQSAVEEGVVKLLGLPDAFLPEKRRDE